MIARIQLRNDTASAWTLVNPVLAQGEMGIESDTLKQKIGDGASDWITLGYSAQPTTDTDLETLDKTVTGAINEVKSSTDSKAPINNPTLTGTVVLPSTTSIGNVSNTEISYLDGVTSGIQGQLNNKQPLDSDLTALADLSSNGVIVKTGSGTATTRSIATSGVGISVTNGDGVSANPTIVSNATSSNTADTIVLRNVDGNFNAGTITATLNGSASTLTNARTIGAMTGDVTSDGSNFDGSANNSNVATIGANKVTNAKLAQMPTMTIKGNDAIGNANPQDLTVPEVRTMIADTNNRFVTDAQITQWSGATEPRATAKAWVNFNGTGMVTIRSSYNVISITDNGTGDYAVQFTTPMSDTNYAVNVSSGTYGNISAYRQNSSPTSLTINYVRVNCGYGDSGTNYNQDHDIVTVTVFGN